MNETKPKSLAERLKASRDTPRFPLIPEGQYVVEFSGMIPQLSRQKNEQVEATLTIIVADDPQWVGATFKTWLMLETDGIWRTTKLLEELGFDLDLFQKNTDLCRYLMGIESGVDVVHQVDQKGIPRARVDNYWKTNNPEQEKLIAEYNAKAHKVNSAPAVPGAKLVSELKKEATALSSASSPAPDSELKSTVPLPQEPVKEPSSPTRSDAKKAASTLRERIQKQMGS